jgi:hypothetical protein
LIQGKQIDKPDQAIRLDELLPEQDPDELAVLVPPGSGLTRTGGNAAAIERLSGFGRVIVMPRSDDPFEVDADLASLRRTPGRSPNESAEC